MWHQSTREIIISQQSVAIHSNAKSPPQCKNDFPTKCGSVNAMKYGVK